MSVFLQLFFDLEATVTPILYFIFLAGSAAIAWFVYLQPLWHYAQDMGVYTLTLAISAMIFMFMYRVRLNECGHVVFIGFPIGITCKPGTYWTPNFLPFLQAVGFFAGLGIEQERTNSFGEIGGNPNITHNVNVALNSHRVTHETKSLFALNLDRLLGLLGAFLFSFHDREGRFKFYKLGALLYATAWMLAFFSHTQNYVSQAIATASDTMQQTMLSFGLATPSINSGRVVRLNIGDGPIIPEWKGFVPDPTEEPHYTKVRGADKPYVFYSEPSSGDVGRVMVKESLCSMIPKGRKIFYWTTTPPTHASNVDDEVTYISKRYGFALGGWFEGILLEPKAATWVYLREHWSEVDSKHHPILTKAMEAYELPPNEDGGLVCF